jgi:tRNA U54 and U55 pseudouridine synthase Pus10
VRKGRNSVEEIICEAVRGQLSSSINGGGNADGGMKVKMHSCGREDIDVRMLGNYPWIS